MKSKNAMIKTNGHVLIGPHQGKGDFYKLRLYCHIHVPVENLCCEIPNHESCPKVIFFIRKSFNTFYCRPSFILQYRGLTFFEDNLLDDFNNN